VFGYFLDNRALLLLAACYKKLINGTFGMMIAQDSNKIRLTGRPGKDEKDNECWSTLNDRLFTLLGDLLLGSQ
jgi:hypothetical protein